MQAALIFVQVIDFANLWLHLPGPPQNAAGRLVKRTVKVISYARTFALNRVFKAKRGGIENLGEVGRFRGQQLAIYNVGTRRLGRFEGYNISGHLIQAVCPAFHHGPAFKKILRTIICGTDGVLLLMSELTFYHI